jgi:hypothetical protein
MICGYTHHNYIRFKRGVFQEALHIGLVLFGGEQPVGGLLAAKKGRKLFFLIF